MKTYLIVSSLLGLFLIGSSLVSDGGDRKILVLEPIHFSNEHWGATHAHILDSGNKIFWFW